MAEAGLPIGVFDSGMGGLTVLSALHRAMPCEDFVYLGDTARLPYGTKSPVTVQRYASLAANRLVDKGVKALVIACNTASAVALEDLARRFAPLPVFGVVQPGAQAAAAQADRSGVLVLGTESTIAGGAYQAALTRLAPQVPIFARPCPLWVTLAEQGPQSSSFVDHVLLHTLRGFVAQGPKTVLLGCTHFPIFKPALEGLLPHVGIVDSAQTTANAVVEALQTLGLQSAVKTGTLRFLATDGAARFVRVGSHFLGKPIAEVEVVDL